MERCGLALELPEESVIQASENISIASMKVARFINMFKAVLPEDGQFLPEYKNPCWNMEFSREQRTDLHHSVAMHNMKPRNIFMCLPYFFVPGFMKSGTTTLYQALGHHPEVIPLATKEPQWWHKLPLSDNSYTEPKMEYYIKKYFKMFLRSSQIISLLPSTITLDASADTVNRSPYIIDSQDYCILPLILSKVLPQAKFVVLMRNPVRRTYSHFLYACSQKFTWNTSNWPEEVRTDPAELFHQQAVLTVNKFKDCLQVFSLFECANVWRYRSALVDHCGEVGFRLVNSIYYSYLAKWLHVFPREQFLFLKTEDMDSKSYEFMRNITDFLGLSPMSRIKANAVLSRSMNHQAFASQSASFQLKEKTLTLLEKFFQPFNSMLSNLLGDNRFLWKD